MNCISSYILFPPDKINLSYYHHANTRILYYGSMYNQDEIYIYSHAANTLRVYTYQKHYQLLEEEEDVLLSINDDKQ